MWVTAFSAFAMPLPCPGAGTTPIGITNAFSVGVVRDVIAAEAADPDSWALPVVGETYDGFLNALLAAETMTGRDGNTAYALDSELLLEALATRA